MNPYLTLTFVIIGCFMVLVTARTMRPLLNQPADSRNPRYTFWGALRAAVKTLWLPSHYDAQVGGYVHDTSLSAWISPNMCSYLTGTWTDSAGAVTGTITKAKATTDETGVIHIPISSGLILSSTPDHGSYFRSMDLYYAITGAALDAAGATVLLDRFVLPINGAAFPTLSAEAFSYDSGNDAAAESDDLDEHRMTITPTTPFWVPSTDLFQARLTLDAGASSVIKFHGARLNYTLRL